MVVGDDYTQGRAERHGRGKMDGIQRTHSGGREITSPIEQWLIQPDQMYRPHQSTRMTEKMLIPRGVKRTLRFGP